MQSTEDLSNNEPVDLEDEILLLVQIIQGSLNNAYRKPVADGAGR